MLRYAVAGGIRGYQLYVSPYKGFRCAYKARVGRWSCSEYARRLAMRLGAGALLRGLPKQFARCKAAYLALMAKSDEEKKSKRAKRHWTDRCDCCDPSFLPGSKGCLPNPGDILHCDAGPCDCSP